jgi:hypothetical protein
MNRIVRQMMVLFLLGWAVVCILPGCSNDTSTTSPDSVQLTQAEQGEIVAEQRNPIPPGGLVTVSFGSRSLEFWPYTGSSFDGTPVDPVNVIFLGQADPLQIRAALLALDGDRTAYGFPNVFPFNARWSDAIGDVQTTYADGDGWVGSVVQLQIGDYEPIRWHLRVFRTGSGLDGNVWTLGAAHFEMMIPGTADHQVLGWDRAQEIVTVDMLRSGLLDPTVPMLPTGIVNESPTFRSIPPFLYNPLPEDLKNYILGPNHPENVTVPVGIPNDGSAMIFNLAGAATVTPGVATQNFTKTYQQVIPKPLCNPDGSQWVLVQGPVDFAKSVEIGAGRTLTMHYDYSGTLTVTPWDIVHNVPLGDPYSAEVGGSQEAFLHTRNSRIAAADGRIAHEADGTELLRTELRISSPGLKRYILRTSCLGGGI